VRSGSRPSPSVSALGRASQFLERGKSRLVMPPVAMREGLLRELPDDKKKMEELVAADGLTALGRPQAASLFRWVCKQIRSPARVLFEGSAARPGYRR
jgi:hypothetical protein